MNKMIVVSALLILSAPMYGMNPAEVKPAPVAKKSLFSYLPARQTAVTYTVAGAVGAVAAVKFFKDGKLPAVIANQKVAAVAGVFAGAVAVKTGTYAVNVSKAMYKSRRGNGKPAADIPLVVIGDPAASK